MKVYIKAILLIQLIIFSQCANMRRSKSQQTPIQELSQIGEKSQFAKNLYLTINLSLQSGGKVSEVIDFVNEAKNEAATERNAITQAFNQEKASLQDTISKLQSELDGLQTQHDEVIEVIDELQQEITQLKARLARLNEEEQAILERERAVEEVYNADQIAFRERNVRDANTISALEEIIPSLQALRDQGNAFLERSHTQILNALQKIPKKDPIRILTQLSTKFDEEKLNEVIYKLIAILESVQKSKAQDEANQQTSDQRFQAFQGEIKGLIQAKSNAINQAQTDLNAKEQALRHNQSFEGSLASNINQTTNVLNQNKSILETATNTYNTNYEALTETMESLQEALNILTENEATLESQEQQAANDLEGNGFFGL